MNLKGTKTEANLQTAFAGESQARNKYTYYASKARKDGYQQIAALFEETAANEKEHAKLWFKLLHGGQIASTRGQPARRRPGRKLRVDGHVRRLCQRGPRRGLRSTSQPCLKAWAEIEKAHEDRYRKLLENVENGLVFCP